MQRRYDRPIIIQRGTPSQSSSGAETITWADIAYRVFAHVAPTRGSERVAPSQEVAEQELTFTLRYHEIPSASRPLQPKDRIIYPADGIAADTQSPTNHLIHDIVASDEVGREVDLSIKTIRRVDITS